MMHQCKFMSCYKYTALVRDVNNTGSYIFVGAGFMWKISVPSFQFCCGPKTAFNNALAIIKWFEVKTCKGKLRLEFCLRTFAFILNSH